MFLFMFQLVSLLLQNGADAERRNSLNETPLDVAANAEVCQTICNKMLCTRNMMDLAGFSPVNWCNLQSSNVVFSNCGLDDHVATTVQSSSSSSEKITSRVKKGKNSKRNVKKSKSQ